MRFSALIFSFLTGLLSITPAAATSLLPISLEQLSTRAELIFYGTVISNQVEKDAKSGHVVTFTEFEVLELIKDRSGDHDHKTHTIKQLGGRLNSHQTSLIVQGIPQYQVGSSYVVFLPKASAMGFCSPLGLHQGSFSVTTIDGEQIISNGHGLAQQSSLIVPNTAAGASARTSTAVPLVSPVTVPLAVNSNTPSQAKLDAFINSVCAYNQPYR